MQRHDLARQRAMWLSMKETLINKRVVLTPEYDDINTRMRKDMQEQGASTARLDEEIQTFKSQLVAIASGKPITRGEKQVKIELTLVHRVLAGIEGSYVRIDHLIDPEWKP
jgi:hypothetical protein